LKSIIHYLLIILFFFSFSYSALLYADEIYLKDSKVINCKIIQITDNTIEYREQDGKPFLTLPKSLALKVVYENGDFVLITENNINEEKIDNEKPIQNTITGNMYNSLFGIYLFGSAGFPWGDILDTEHDLSYITIQYSNGVTKTGRPDHMLYYYGLNGDFYLYTSESIKTGIRARFAKGIINQETTVGGGQYETKNYYATLMDFNALMCGGILIWSPFSHRNVAFTPFLTVGKLIYSKIHPMPTLQKENGSAYPLPKKSYDVEGYVINAGAGAQYAFSTIILGLNIVYTQFYINIEDNPYRPLVSDKTNLYAISLELFAGVHF
jgi:hypothetical protein